MKARLHKGGFGESMATMKEINANVRDLSIYIHEAMIDDPCFNFNPASMIDKFSFTQVGIDSRSGWFAPTYLVEIKGWGLIGMVSELPFNKNKRKDEFQSEYKKLRDNLFEKYSDLLDNISMDWTFKD